MCDDKNKFGTLINGKKQIREKSITSNLFDENLQEKIKLISDLEKRVQALEEQLKKSTSNSSSAH